MNIDEPIDEPIDEISSWVHSKFTLFIMYFQCVVSS